MVHLLLHIGTEKTGSTAIQQWIKDNEDTLTSSSIGTLHALGWPNAVKLAAASSSFTHPRPLHAHQQITDTASWEKFRKRLRRETARELRSSRRKRTVVVSNEHLSSQLRSQDDVDRLRDFFEGLVDTVEIVVYLRRQDRMAQSRYGTAILAGSTSTDPFRAQGPGFSVYRYDELLERYANAFSKSSVNARIYDRIITADGGVIGDFLRVLNVDFDMKSGEPRSNRAIDPAILQLLRQVNERGPISRRARRSLQNVAKTFMAEPVESPPERAERFLEQFVLSNERLRSEWFPGLEAVFPEAAVPVASPIHPRPTGDSIEPSESQSRLLAEFVARLAEG